MEGGLFPSSDVYFNIFLSGAEGSPLVAAAGYIYIFSQYFGFRLMLLFEDDDGLTLSNVNYTCHFPPK